MTWIEHGSDYINIISHHFNILTGSGSASVPAVSSVNIDTNRCFNIFPGISQEVSYV